MSDAEQTPPAAAAEAGGSATAEAGSPTGEAGSPGEAGGSLTGNLGDGNESIAADPAPSAVSTESLAPAKDDEDVPQYEMFPQGAPDLAHSGSVDVQRYVGVVRNDVVHFEDDGNDAFRLGGSAARNAMVEANALLRRGVALIHLEAMFCLGFGVLAFVIAMFARGYVAVFGGLLILLCGIQLLACNHTSGIIVFLLSMYSVAANTTAKARKMKQKYDVLFSDVAGTKGLEGAGDKPAGFDVDAEDEDKDLAWITDKMTSVNSEVYTKTRLYLLPLPLLGFLFAFLCFVLVIVLGPETVVISNCEADKIEGIKYGADIEGNCCPDEVKFRGQVRTKLGICIAECPHQKGAATANIDFAIDSYNLLDCCDSIGNSNLYENFTSNSECWCSLKMRGPNGAITQSFDELRTRCTARNAALIPVDAVTGERRILLDGSEQQARIPRFEGDPRVAKPQRTQRKLADRKEKKELTGQQKADLLSLQHTVSVACASLLLLLALFWVVFACFILFVVRQGCLAKIDPFVSAYIDLLSWQLSVTSNFSPNLLLEDRVSAFKELNALQGIQHPKDLHDVNTQAQFDWDLWAMEDTEGGGKKGKGGKGKAKAKAGKSKGGGKGRASKGRGATPKGKAKRSSVKR